MKGFDQQLQHKIVVFEHLSFSIKCSNKFHLKSQAVISMWICIKWQQRKNHMATAYFHSCPSIECAALQSSASQAERTQTNNTNEENQHELSILDRSTIKTVNSVWTCKFVCFVYLSKICDRDEAALIHPNKLYEPKTFCINTKMCIILICYVS